MTNEEDCISRQAVNDLVDELARAISDERSHISRGRSTGRIMQDILDLPPVTPKQEPYKDCISREEAIKWMENIRTLNHYYHPEDNDDETLVSEVIGRLNQLPSVTPKEKTGK